MIKLDKAAIRILSETASMSLDINKIAIFLDSLQVGAGFKPAPTTNKINITTGCLFSSGQSANGDNRGIAVKLAGCKALDSRFRGNDIEKDGNDIEKDGNDTHKEDGNDIKKNVIPSLTGNPWQPYPAEIAYEQKRLQGSTTNSSFLYDGFKLADLFREVLELKNINTIAFIYTDRLVGSKDTGGRWHARTAVFSYPCIISIPGIVQAPARSRKYHLMKQLSQSLAPNVIPSLTGNLDSCLRRNDIEKDGNDTHKENGNDIFHDEDYIFENDPRIAEAANSYTLQALYYVISGNPFCGKTDCRLFNSHWQKEVINAQVNGNICLKHQEVLKRWLKFQSFA